MTKHKIKPEVVWMPWHERMGFHIERWEFTKDIAWEMLVEKMHCARPELRKQGWRIVKVRISEVK